MYYIEIVIFSLFLASSWGTECGGTYRGFQYKLTSPNYPHEYSNGRDCVYHLQGDTQGSCEQDFHLYFQDFSVKASENCEGDFLQVGQRHVFCGTVVGVRKFTGKNNTLTLKFHSDDKGTAKGFKILVTALPCDIKLESLKNPGLTEDKPSWINNQNIQNHLSIHRDIRGDGENNKNDSNNSFSTNLSTSGAQLNSLSPSFASSNLKMKTTPHITSYLFVPPSESNPTAFNNLHLNPKIQNFNSETQLASEFLPPGPSPAKAFAQLSKDKLSSATWDKSSSVIIPARNYGEPGFGVVDYDIQVGNDCNQRPPYITGGGVSNSFDFNNYNPVSPSISSPGVLPAISSTGVLNPFESNNYNLGPSGGSSGHSNSFGLNNYNPTPPVVSGGGLPNSLGVNNYEPPPFSNGGLSNSLSVNYNPSLGQNVQSNNNKVDSPANVVYDPQQGLVNLNNPYGGFQPYQQNFNPNFGLGISPYNQVLPPGGWGECCRVQSGRRFSIVSPGFPSGNSNPYSCRYTITKSSPDVCSLRMNFRYFNFGSEDPYFCRNGHMEIDGQRFCGCRSGQNFRIPFSDYYPKTITVSYAGQPRGRFSGFMIDVYQEPCGPPGYGNGVPPNNPFNYGAGFGNGALLPNNQFNYGAGFANGGIPPNNPYDFGSGYLRRQERTAFTEQQNSTDISPSPLDPLYHSVNKRDLGYTYSKPNVPFNIPGRGDHTVAEGRNQERIFGGSCQSRIFFDWVVAFKESVLRNVRCNAGGYGYPNFNARSYLPPDNAKVDKKIL